FSSRRRHTRFSRDWSSDVCSSDLKVTTFLATENGAPDWNICHHWLAPDTDAMYLFAATYRLERHRAKEVQRRIDELLADLGRYREEAEGSPTARNYRSLLAIAPDA